MVTEKTLERINELYHKSKAEGLTDAELAEQIGRASCRERV